MITSVLAAIAGLAGLAMLILKHFLSRKRIARLRDKNEWEAKEVVYDRMARAIENGDVVSARRLLAHLQRRMQKQNHSDSGERGTGEDSEG